MSGIYGVGNSYYNPYSAATFTSRPEYRGPEDFKPGLYDPEQREKAAKRKRNVLLVAATAVGVAAAWFFTKGKGKGLINRLKDLLRGTKSVADDAAKGAKEAAEEAAETVKKTVNKSKKTKVKPKHKVVAEHVEIQPGKPQKMTGGGGKDAIRKARHNKKQIIQEKIRQERAEKITLQDLEEHSRQLGTPATQAERQWIEKNNKPATNTLGDFMDAQGLERTHDKSGKVVISKKAEVPKAKPAKTEAPKVETPNAAKPQVPAATPQNISDVETKIANLKGRIENHSKFKGFSNGPQMQKMQAELKNLEAQLVEMQKSVKAAA